MGQLIDGVWHDIPRDTKSTGGRFVRNDTAFRDWVSADGASGYPAESGRYRLYVSLACPWAHRALIYRALKGLEEALPVSVVDWLMLEKGWEFKRGCGSTGDPIYDADYLHQIYIRAKPGYTGRASVPVLFDMQSETIVSNESSEIIRMLNTEFDAFATRDVPDLYPVALRDEIDEVNARVYDTVNNGVYKSGFATAQDAYDDEVTALFDTLDWLEERLSGQRYLLGERITEADWRLFTTLVRFDPVYHGHFKCNIRRLVDYPNLWGYTRELYQVPHIAETVDLEHIKRHYYESHRHVNPTGIVPKGPAIDFAAPHDRDRLPKAA
jgi:putative glutathione S-transferase